MAPKPGPNNGRLERNLSGGSTRDECFASARDARRRAGLRSKMFTMAALVVVRQPQERHPQANHRHGGQEDQNENEWSIHLVQMQSLGTFGIGYLEA